MIFIDGIIFSLQKTGGISVYFCEIVNRLKNFELFIYKNGNKHLKELNSNKKLNSVMLFSKLPLILIRLMDVHVPKKFTVFHSTYYRLPYKWQRGRLKIITTVHDFTNEKYGSGISRLFHTFQKKRAILGSDVIVCISENTKKDLLSFLPEVKNKHIEVIYNGVSDKFKPIVKKIDEMNKNLLYIGSRAEYKNFGNLVCHLNSLKKFNLIFVGGGPLTNMEIKLLASNIPNRFEHLPFLDEEKLNDLYNSSFCLVYPSFYEGFGIPVVEAMQAGCPIIALKSSCIPEISDNSCILLDNFDFSNLRKSLLKLEDNSYRKEILKKGFDRASYFSWDIMFENLDKIYKEPDASNRSFKN